MGLTWSCACGGGPSGPLDHSPCSSGQPHFCQGGGSLSISSVQTPSRQAVSPSPRGSSENTRTNEPKQLLGLKSLWQTGCLSTFSALHHLFLSPACLLGHW